MPNLPNGTRSGRACSFEITTDAWNAEFSAVESLLLFTTLPGTSCWLASDLGDRVDELPESLFDNDGGEKDARCTFYLVEL